MGGFCSVAKGLCVYLKMTDISPVVPPGAVLGRVVEVDNLSNEERIKKKP